VIIIYIFRETKKELLREIITGGYRSKKDPKRQERQNRISSVTSSYTHNPKYLSPYSSALTDDFYFHRTSRHIRPHR